MALSETASEIFKEAFKKHKNEILNNWFQQTLFHGKNVALACIEPETKDIYFFEGNQFIQKSLKQIY